MKKSGAQVIAESLKSLEVEHVFGIVGIPVIEVAEACIDQGVRFIGFRNEQSAVYAASIYGFLTGKPGVCLVVGGPGVVHALAGVENAKANRCPLLLLAGSAETNRRGQGAFQQLDQVSLVKAAGAKFAEQLPSLVDTTRLIRQAYYVSFYGQPGTAYIDLPANLIEASVNTSSLDASSHAMVPLRLPPKCMGDPVLVEQAAKLIKTAKFPLLIVGKGCAYARSEALVRELQSETKLPFLPTPMGKGVISDDNAANVSAARSLALKSADVILVLGARLNWILHFKEPPKFRVDVRTVQVDSVPEEVYNADIGIWGDVGLVCQQLTAELRDWRAPPIPAFIDTQRQSNEARAYQQEQLKCPEKMLTYKPVYSVIKRVLDHHVKQPIIYVSEGANTMDISRTSFPLSAPRTRLDAGTNATMGVGMGYAIAAKTVNPEAVVVALEGDSAFGFSAMEIETAVRSKLPMLIFVMNNSGVYHGSDPKVYATNQPLPPTALSVHTKYHLLAESLGAKGYLAETLDELAAATESALESQCVAVINVILDPQKDKKLEFGWMRSAKL